MRMNILLIGLSLAQSVGWYWFLTRRPEFANIVRICGCKIQFRYFNASFATKQKMCGICLDVYLRWRQLARASGGTCTLGQGHGAEARARPSV